VSGGGVRSHTKYETYSAHGPYIILRYYNNARDWYKNGVCACIGGSKKIITVKGHHPCVYTQRNKQTDSIDVIKSAKKKTDNVREFVQ